VNSSLTVHSSTVALDPARSFENVRLTAGRKSPLQYHGEFCSHSQRIHGGGGGSQRGKEETDWSLVVADAAVWSWI
jgi:hypothetical protein